MADTSTTSNQPIDQSQSSTSSTTSQQEQNSSEITPNGHHDNETETSLENPNSEENESYVGEFDEEIPLDLESGMTCLQPKLDCHLAIIEEQFRRGFDERYSTSKQPITNKFWEDPNETMRTNKAFREVSRGLGTEWRPIFEDLMADFPKETIEMELGKIGASQPIIQGYKALTCWKEVSSKSFTLMKLVDVLRKHNLDDIADAVIHIIDNADGSTDSKEKTAKPVVRRKSDLASRSKNPSNLDNRRLLLISKKIGGQYEKLAKELQISDEELKEIQESEGSTYQGAFKVLWAWKETRPMLPLVEGEEGSKNSDVQVLKEALEKVNMKDLADQIDSLK